MKTLINTLALVLCIGSFAASAADTAPVAKAPVATNTAAKATPVAVKAPAAKAVVTKTTAIKAPVTKATATSSKMETVQSVKVKTVNQAKKECLTKDAKLKGKDLKKCIQNSRKVTA